MERLALLKTAIMWGGATAIIGTAVATLLRLVSPQASAHSLDQAPANIAIFVLSALVLAPIIETIIFQSLPIEMLRKLRAPDILIVLVCAVLFGLGHAVYGGTNKGVKTFVDGAIFGSLYLRTRTHSLSASYWSVAVAHFTNNLLVLSVGAILVATGLL